MNTSFSKSWMQAVKIFTGWNNLYQRIFPQTLNQIKARKYPDSVKEYSGNLLLVGISYDSKSKLHQCIIEEYLKAVD